MLRPLSDFPFPDSSLEDVSPSGNSVTIDLRRGQTAKYLVLFLQRCGIIDAKIFLEDSRDGRIVIFSQAATRKKLAEALRELNFNVLET